jgi:hypothetical protein
MLDSGAATVVTDRLNPSTLSDTDLLTLFHKVEREIGEPEHKR